MSISNRNEKIINCLIGINNLYEKKFEQFPYKDDPMAVFEFECLHYVNILTDKIVPLLAQYLEKNPTECIDTYLSFIHTKYQECFKNDIICWKKRELENLKINSKKMIKQLSFDLLIQMNKSEEKKHEFIINFTEKHEKQLIEMCWHNTELFLQTVAQFSNPKLQYMILNVLNKDIQEQCSDFLSKISQSNLDKIIERYICYPLDIQMDEYCDKWIGKDKIYVKFLNKLLGSRYEYVKTYLKMAKKNKKSHFFLENV